MSQFGGKQFNSRISPALQKEVLLETNPPIYHIREYRILLRSRFGRYGDDRSGGVSGIEGTRDVVCKRWYKGRYPESWLSLRMHRRDPT